MKLETTKIGLKEAFGAEKPTDPSEYFHQLKASKRRILLDLLAQESDKKPKWNIVITEPDHIVRFATQLERINSRPTQARRDYLQNERRPANSLRFRPGKSGMWINSGS